MTSTDKIRGAFAALLLALTAPLQPATAEVASPAFDHAAFAKATIENHIRPLTSAFSASAEKLEANVAKLCSAPRPKVLAAARQAFKAAALAYGRIDHLKFGPSREANRHERILLFPDPKGLVRKQVDKVIAARDVTVLDSQALYGKSVALQGFSALELLLYGTDAPLLLKAGGRDTFRCGYAAAIGKTIAKVAADLQREWADEQGYARLMLHPSADNAAYLRNEEVTIEIVSSLVNGLESVRDVRLAGPIGLRAVDKAPTTGVLDVAQLTVPYIAANIEGLQSLYRDSGLEGQLAKSDQSMAELIDRELATSLRLARSVKSGVRTARTQSAARQSLIAMGFPLKNARLLTSELVTQAANLSLGFNAGDGD